jgi:hypothetical protein
MAPFLTLKQFGRGHHDLDPSVLAPTFFGQVGDTGGQRADALCLHLI